MYRRRFGRVTSKASKKVVGSASSPKAKLLLKWNLIDSILTNSHCGLIFFLDIVWKYLNRYVLSDPFCVQRLIWFLFTFYKRYLSDNPFSASEKRSRCWHSQTWLTLGKWEFSILFFFLSIQSTKTCYAFVHILYLLYNHNSRKRIKWKVSLITNFIIWFEMTRSQLMMNQNFNLK